MAWRSIDRTHLQARVWQSTDKKNTIEELKSVENSEAAEKAAKEQAKETASSISEEKEQGRFEVKSNEAILFFASMFTNHPTMSDCGNMSG